MEEEIKEKEKDNKTHLVSELICSVSLSIVHCTAPEILVIYVSSEI